MAGLPPPEEWYDALGSGRAQRPRRRHRRRPAWPQSCRNHRPTRITDVTLDGRSVFWSAGQPSRAMPAPADFVLLLERHVLEQPET
jgi:hypothetical protein